MLVTGAPSFPFYMPGSGPVADEAEALIRQRAIELVQRGYQAGAYIDPGDPYLGNVLSSGSLYYQNERVPGHHFQQRYVDGRAYPPVMLPGSLDSRIALQIAENEAYGDGGRGSADLDRNMRAYQMIVDEAERRARQGQPIRLGRQARG